MTSRRSARQPPYVSGSVALAASLLLHALGALGFRGLGHLPAIELAIVEPDQAEFGVVEPTPPTPPTPPASVEPPDPRPSAVSDDPGTRVERPKRKPARPEVKNQFPEAGDAGRFAPEGSQIALRVDVERIETGPLASEVRALIAALPDIRWLLADSGVDPLRDLSRLFVATPDLKREHVVLAGRYRGGADVARAAAARLAAQHGQVARFRTQHGVAVAPWLNQADSPHVLALLGHDAFAITRQEDLPRVLAVARTLSGRASAANALVHMDERELLSLSVERARSFTRGARVAQVPDRLAVSVRSDPHSTQSLHIAVTALYPDAAQARAAFEYWDELRTRYANHTLLALFGVASLLRDAQLANQRERITLQLQVSESEARMLLRWARDSVHPRVAAKVE